jgi:hypothetical protein
MSSYFIYLLYVIIPLSLTAFLFPIGSVAGKEVKQRPPAYVFGIAWTILYLFIAGSWYLTRNESYARLLFVILIASLCLWIAIYRYNKKCALWCIAACVTISLGVNMWCMKVNTTAGFLLIPLTGWLMFAAMLNFREIDLL